MEEKLGGLQFFLDGIWGALKCQKMTLGGSSSFFLSFFNQHFDKKI